MRRSTETCRPESCRRIARAAAATGLAAAIGMALSVNAAAETPAGTSGLTIQVLIYSGRPDPLFVIRDPAQIAKLKQLLDQAAPDQAADAAKSILPSVLGYKGFLILNPGALGGLPREVAVFQQRVQTRDGGSRRVLSDNGAIESFLAGEAERSKALDARALEILRTGRGGNQGPR
jgi:hypothetical protein